MNTDFCDSTVEPRCIDRHNGVLHNKQKVTQVTTTSVGLRDKSKDWKTCHGSPTHYMEMVSGGEASVLHNSVLSMACCWEAGSE
jgi:hypothetical protein